MWSLVSFEGSFAESEVSTLGFPCDAPKYLPSSLARGRRRWRGWGDPGEVRTLEKSGRSRWGRGRWKAWRSRRCRREGGSWTLERPVTLECWFNNCRGRVGSIIARVSQKRKLDEVIQPSADRVISVGVTGEVSKRSARSRRSLRGPGKVDSFSCVSVFRFCVLFCYIWALLIP